MQPLRPAPAALMQQQQQQQQDRSLADTGMLIAPPSPGPEQAFEFAAFDDHHHLDPNPSSHPSSHPHLTNMLLSRGAVDLRQQLSQAISSPLAYADAALRPHSNSPDEHNIDPAIGGPPGGMMSTGGGGGGSGDDDSLGNGKGKARELSHTKRAAQNRAAQRAFRQRKEGYIKKLEEQVREKNSLEDNLKAVQAENYSLREYIIHLQGRLIDNQQEFPEPPANVNLQNPPPPRPDHMQVDPQQQQQQQQQPPQHMPVRHENGGPIAPMAPMNPLQTTASRTLQQAGLKHDQDTRAYEQHKRLRDDTENAAAEDLIRSQLGAAPHSNNHGLPTMSN